MPKTFWSELCFANTAQENALYVCISSHLHCQGPRTLIRLLDSPACPPINKCTQPWRMLRSPSLSLISWNLVFFAHVHLLCGWSHPAPWFLDTAPKLTPKSPPPAQMPFLNSKPAHCNSLVINSTGMSSRHLKLNTSKVNSFSPANLLYPQASKSQLMALPGF